MITPGLIVYIIYYIKKSTARFENSTILRKYHIHEGLVGIIFLLVGLLIMILFFKLQFLRHPYWKSMSYLLLITQAISYISLYLGGFLFFRDWRDVFKFKFIEIKVKQKINQIATLESAVHHSKDKNLLFFKSPKLIIYPLGIAFTIFSINMVIFGNIFFPERIFRLSNEEVIYLGYILCVFAAAIIGIDWFRIYKKFYPDIYQEIFKKTDMKEKENI